ncbi:leukemia inhibitory factor receptor-like isoform X1 [Phyllopteryx taeniolatus]|uniref:leukemia inhibitory factor receptor-like isoform X1 n=1 Tax=Phyllopteryx taeniolatus TaxID=161469 RepID=UPI002AD27707|nr:leukemia inhibitory factor receptor-like isoform X1 [Phyllopteryx taeniolatus]
MEMNCKMLLKGIRPHSLMIMIPWLLLASLFCNSTQDGHFKEDGVFHCRPQNITVSASDYVILLRWQDDPSCESVRDVLTYELEVLVADKFVHYEEVAVTPDQIGSPHSWNWSSHLATECASHTLKLRSRSQNRTSQWKLEQIVPAGHNHSDLPEVYPRDNVFEVGSRATFCCVLPTGQVLERLYLNGNSSTKWDVRNISSHTYALTVDLNRASTTSCTDIICETKTSENGACAYIGYPPGDRDLTCETRDFQSVECLWTVGPNTRLAIGSPTTYQLLGSQCADGSNGRCSHKMQVDVGERNWTLTAENQLATVVLTDRADLTNRVRMFAPQKVKVLAVNSDNVRLQWEWAIRIYEDLDITCRLNISDGETHAVTERVGVGLSFAVLKGLIPNWTYTATIRCGTSRHLWKWSEWSSSAEFRTTGDVPDALDVWTQVKGNQTIITWKVPLAKQSHGDIVDYEMTWAPTSGRRERARVTHPEHSFALRLDSTKEYAVSVRARNQYGSSSPSTITIPVLNAGSGGVKLSRTRGTHGAFNLSWSASPTASCGYIVDWCPAVGPCAVDWLRVPPSETQVNIFSKNLKEGVRYLLSIHACTHRAPVLLERVEGYVKEKIIQDRLFKTLRWKQRDMDVEVSWDPVALREQPAFVRGYTLYYWDNMGAVMNTSTDNCQATSLTAKSLQITSYTFTVKANTAVGQCGATSITATLNSLTDNLIKAIGITLATIFVLLCLIVTLCYRNWECIKLKVYPPIPMPVLKDKWMTSLTKQSCHPVFVEMRHHTEAELMAIPVLHSKSEAPATDCVDRGNVSSPTTNGHRKTPDEKLRASSAAIPRQAPLLPPTLLSSSPSAVKDGHLNPSFNLTPTDASVEGSNGYQPQKEKGQPEDVPENPLPCVFAYILLPQLPSE